MTSEQYVALAVASISTIGVILAAILPAQIKTWRENRRDHAKVHVSVQELAGTVKSLARQVDTLTTLVVTSAADLKAHAQWEEGNKHVTPEHIQLLIEAVTASSETTE